MRATWKISTALVGVLGGGACQRPCGLDAGSEGGLTVTVVDAATREGRLGEGAYMFTVTTEVGEATWSCVVDAAHPDGEACATSQAISTGAEADEADDEEEATTLLLAAHVTDGVFLLELSLLRAGGTTGPDEVEVVVARDGATVAMETLAPKYVLSRAGGDGCGQSYVVDEAPVVELTAVAR